MACVLPCQHGGGHVIARQSETHSVPWARARVRRLPCGVRLQDDAPTGDGGYGSLVRTFSEAPAAHQRPPLTKRLSPRHWAALDYVVGAVFGLILFASHQEGRHPGYRKPVRLRALPSALAHLAAGHVPGHGGGRGGGHAPPPPGVHARRAAGRLGRRDHADRPGERRPDLLPARGLRALPGRGDLRAPAGRGARAHRRVRHPGGRRGAHPPDRRRVHPERRAGFRRAVRDHRLVHRLHRASAAPVRGQAARRGGQQGGRRGAPAHRQGTARCGRAQHERHRGPGGLRPVRHRHPARRRAQRPRRHPGHQPGGSGRDAPDARRPPPGGRDRPRLAARGAGDGSPAAGRSPAAGGISATGAADSEVGGFGGVGGFGSGSRGFGGRLRCTPRLGWPTWTGCSRAPRARASGWT